MPTGEAKPQNSVTTREIGPLSLRASFNPKTIDAAKRTVELVWATAGVRVMRGFYDRFWEELSLDPKHVRMERLSSGRAPLLNSHDDYDLGGVLGVVESAKVDGKTGTAVVRFAKAEDSPEADKIFRLVQDGIIANVSVGYRVHRFEKIEIEGDKIPVQRATDWEPLEVSLCPIGADAGAGTRSAELAGTNLCEFTTRSEETTMPKTTDSTPSAAPAVTPAPTPETAAPVATPAPVVDDVTRAAETEATRAVAVREEQVRVRTILDLCKRRGLGDDFANKLVTGNVQLDGPTGARAAILDADATRSEQIVTENHIRIEGGESDREKFIRGVSAWIFEATGVAGKLARAQKMDPVLSKVAPRHFADLALDPGEFRGMRLVDIAEECLKRSGVKTRGMSRMQIVGEVFKRSAYQTTSDFAVLFENVMHKTLLGAYATQDDTWAKFCKTDTVPDFRPSNRFRSASLGTLDLVNESGEIKHKAIGDGTKTVISVQSYADILGLSRKTIIDDDMGALTDMAQKLGRAARLTIESAVYALLNANAGLGPTQTDGQPFFHSNRTNVNSTGSALSSAAIDADRVVMGKQMDVGSNEYLNLRPSVLLVPDGLYAAARIINSSIYDHDGTKLQKPNPVVGLFSEVVGSPRLTVTTRRYLFTDPASVAAIVVAFLEGQGQAPTMEVKDGWDVDGVEWKVSLDFKAQMFDPKGAVTNIGQ